MCFVFQQRGTKTAWSARYGKEKTPTSPDVSPPAPWKKSSTQVPLVWNQPHARHIKQETQLWLPNGGKEEKSSKYMGRNQQENHCCRLRPKWKKINKRNWPVRRLPRTTITETKRITTEVASEGKLRWEVRRYPMTHLLAGYFFFFFSVKACLLS